MQFIFAYKKSHLEIRGLFGKFVKFGHKMFKYDILLSYFDISQVDIIELASSS